MLLMYISLDYHATDFVSLESFVQTCHGVNCPNEQKLIFQ